MIWLLFGLAGLGVWLIHDSLLPGRPSVRRPQPAVLTGLREWLAQADVPITPSTFLAVSTGGAVISGLVAHLVFGWLIMDLVGAVLGGGLYPMVLHGRRTRRR